MDKNAIKKYAVWARRELIERVSQRAMIYGITAKDAGNPNDESVNGHLLSQVEKRQRQALIRNIKTKGYEQVMEEVAYTWFNRFAALRFMEVNGYLPSHIRVFTNDAGEFKPQILAEAIHLELEGLDMNKVYELESANKSEELFKYLLIVQCNALNSILPGMFQRIEDYTELLLPDYLLREGSVIEQMVTTIPEEDWTDQVQIIGWLYQYYNTEPKDKVFAELKKNIKITKDTIPAATQQFTPDWIVHYMVENSLGRLWLEGHPNDTLKSEWKYYLDEAEQEPEVRAQLSTIRKEYAALKPEEIRVIDPCMGSGHILCVLFDVLVRIYEDYGYAAREAAVKIVENNLWGLDIDDRAAQLSYFAVMMKARQYDRRFFTRKVQPHVYPIYETNVLGASYKQAMGDFLLSKEHQETLNYLMDVFVDAKEYGSTLKLENRDYEGLRDAWNLTWSQTAGNVNMTLWSAAIDPELPHLIDQAITLVQKYDVVVTNPPYMGASGMDVKLTEYVKKEYPDAKSDMSTVFMERCRAFCDESGFVSMINIPVWMFISSYEKLRVRMLNNCSIINMVHPGRGIFGSDFGTTSFVITNRYLDGYKGTYRRLFDTQGDVETSEVRERQFLDQKGQYISQQEKYLLIPGSPIAYWVSDQLISAFSGKCIDDYGYAGIGMRTGDNNRFLRLWHEVSFQNLLLGCSSREEQKESNKRWIPYNKGGEYRKWYGNNDYVVNWLNDGEEIKENTRKVYPYLGDDLGWKISNESYYYRPGITWSGVTIAKNSFRVYEKGFIFDSGANGYFPYDDKQRFVLAAYLNNCIAQHILSIINPTINTGAGTVKKVPVIMPRDELVLEKIDGLAKDCVKCSQEDWDSFETSWGFREHPFITSARIAIQKGEEITIKQAFEEWQIVAEKRFHRLKENEEELNRIFIHIYGLGDELNPEVDDKDVTVHRADLQREVRSFISYAVGCMFGRYSLNQPGLIYAGGEWDISKYSAFIPDKDAIIPICDDEYFEDDIVGRFVDFVEKAFGKSVLEENLRDIADVVGGKGSSREILRRYFINDFFADHCSVYSVSGSGKRPIYWLFDSGKKNGFKCLIYMHRYQPDTIARIRTDYVHEQQSRYRTAIADLEQRINGASTSERVKLSKQMSKLQAQAEEIRVYEEKIHHLADQMIEIDLDDGVKHNYEIFKDVLAKIK